jgi:hypothetical protein
MAWDDKERTESIFGDFSPGVTPRLEIRLRRIVNDLFVEWN